MIGGNLISVCDDSHFLLVARSATNAARLSVPIAPAHLLSDHGVEGAATGGSG